MRNDSKVWQIQEDGNVPNVVFQPVLEGIGALYRPEVLETVEAAIDALSAELRVLSLDIHDHPELKFQEKHAHDALTSFLSKHGFQVTPHYLLPTAWLATFTHSVSTPGVPRKLRTLGINSEMDALPGVGHACGHNLIAVAGVAVACAAKAAMEKWNIQGRIELLGTPAEEVGEGKVILLENKAYDNMNVCLMCHPAPGPPGSVSLSSSLALQRIHVEFTGHTAHAALSPWEGENALDAAVLSYNNISLLRQQLKPSHRVHGTFEPPAEGKEWSANIIPDNARMLWYVRAPTLAEVQAATKRVVACFEAAAHATGCTVKVTFGGCMKDLRQNKALGDEVANVVKNRYGSIDYEWGIHSASTDFGNVTYYLPSLHPGFSIPVRPNGGNHTPEFAASARTPAAHEACMTVSKALAATGLRVLCDDEFYTEVVESFRADQKARGAV